MAAALLVVASPATAGVGVVGVAYSKVYMKTALKAVGYPVPYWPKLNCTGLGPPINQGPAQGLQFGITYNSFRCTARWQYHGRRTFFAAGSGEGGWLCVGSSIAGCHVLQRGFSLNTGQALTGYVQNRYGVLNPNVVPWGPETGPCPDTSLDGIWALGCFQIPTGPAEIGVQPIESMAGNWGNADIVVGKVVWCWLCLVH